ncbi:MAG: tRNA pseudouridine synthase A [Candidatus Cyclobacteriaceae bacterium M2_1C_046]
MEQNYSYLIHLQFLGYRYHGWITQPEVKTVQGSVEKTIRYVLGHETFKTLGVSRTDAKVSASHFIVQLFTAEPLSELSFLQDLNKNLPADIRGLKIESVISGFNIIQSVKVKEYHYLFSFGDKMHPFCAAIMANFPEDLNIDLMKKGAKLFEGEHDFKNYCKNTSLAADTTREIFKSEIVENHLFVANFFPEKSYIYRVEAKGFMRHQVRMMMGQLIALGRKEISLQDVEDSLLKPTNKKPSTAPAHGLHLHGIEFFHH